MASISPAASAPSAVALEIGGRPISSTSLWRDAFRRLRKNRLAMAGAVVVLFLVVMAVGVLWMGAMRLMEPIELPTNVMLYVAFGGIATELIAFWLLYERQKGNLNMKGAFWHIIQTFVGSLIIIVSALVIRFIGFLAIDPILGMAFGLVLFWASWHILRAALRILLQGTPESFDLDAAIEALQGIEGVKDVHHVHAWTLTSGRNLFSAHLRVRSFSKDGERALHEASAHLKERFGIYFSTLQIEEKCLSSEHGAADIDITKKHPESHAREQPHEHPKSHGG